MKKSDGIKEFLDRVLIDKKTNCWEWAGHIHKSGYGYDRHPLSGLRRTHRISWYLHFGEFDRSLCILHRCDNRKCVNPSHLFIGTQDDNMKDRQSKGRTVNPVGSSHGRSKLTEAIVLRILKSKLNGRQAAKHFKISEPTISMIRKGRIWKHVQ